MKLNARARETFLRVYDETKELDVALEAAWAMQAQNAFKRDFASVAMVQVVRHYKVPANTLLGALKSKRIAWVRQVYYWLLRKWGFSYPEVGALAHKDHTTVMHGVRRVQREVAAESLWGNEAWRVWEACREQMQQ